jgi:hypothetical protein
MRVMMRLSALSWMRYRGFKDRQRVPVKPLTVIIGRNGSGKSVISRLPVLIADGVSDGQQDILDLDAGGILHAASYQDFAFQKGRLPFSLGAEVSDVTEAFEFETTLRYISEFRRLTVERFVLSHNGEIIFEAEIADEAQLTSSQPVHNLYYKRSAITGEVSFTGLLPHHRLIDTAADQVVARGIQAIRQALPPPSYLGPFRKEAGHSNRAPGQKVRFLGPRGERAIDLLAEDKFRNDGKLIEAVDRWMLNELGQGVSLDVSDYESRLFVLDSKNDVRVSLADTGAGFTQVLPIAVQNFACQFGILETSMLIVEQPELHLHPAAHGALVDLYLSTARAPKLANRLNCILETHSEQLIMRLRRRIAEGILPCDDVALWSLNHRESDDTDGEVQSLRAIVFDRDGNPEAWPKGVFEETFQDLSLMRQAVRARVDEA